MCVEVAMGGRRGGGEGLTEVGVTREKGRTSELSCVQLLRGRKEEGGGWGYGRRW
jgi:hypothetical protein